MDDLYVCAQGIVEDSVCARRVKPITEEQCLLPCPYDCVLSLWSDWSPCGHSCSSPHQMALRHRNCTVMAPPGEGRCAPSWVITFLNFQFISKSRLVICCVCVCLCMHAHAYSDYYMKQWRWNLHVMRFAFRCHAINNTYFRHLREQQKQHNKVSNWKIQRIKNETRLQRVYFVM
jgi:hypothetical protein